MAFPPMHFPKLILTAAALLSAGAVAVAGNLSVTSSGAPVNLGLTGAGVSDTFVFAPTISTNTSNYNLRAAAVSAGWDGVQPLNATVTISSGVYVGSSVNNTFAFDTGSGFTAGSVLKLINNGSIIGKGGDGGLGPTNFTGADGGPALRAQAALSITNNGTIGGGGGGGGAGAFNYGQWNSNVGQAGGGGGGGGAGSGIGLGGPRNGSTSATDGIRNEATSGANGTLLTGGSGGVEGLAYPAIANNYHVGGGNGGNGGNLGVAGGNGTSGYFRMLTSQGAVRVASNGGAAGAAVTGNVNITWLATGTRLGAIN